MHPKHKSSLSYLQGRGVGSGVQHELGVDLLAWFGKVVDGSLGHIPVVRQLQTPQHRVTPLLYLLCTHQPPLRH